MLIPPLPPLFILSIAKVGLLTCEQGHVTLNAQNVIPQTELKPESFQFPASPSSIWPPFPLGSLWSSPTSSLLHLRRDQAHSYPEPLLLFYFLLPEHSRFALSLPPRKAHISTTLFHISVPLTFPIFCSILISFHSIYDKILHNWQNKKIVLYKKTQ